MSIFRFVIDTKEKGPIKDYYKNLINENATDESYPDESNPSATEIEFRNLDVGDFQIEYNRTDTEIVPLIVIERKTESDYSISIRDSRYRNQKMRLIELKRRVPGVCVWYLIEGFTYCDHTNDDMITIDEQYKSPADGSFGGRAVTKETVLSAVINTMARDQLNCICTRNVEETVLFLNKTFQKCKQLKNGIGSCIVKRIADLSKESVNDRSSNSNVLNPLINKELEYASTIKLKRKDNMTPSLCFKYQLAQIPGMSIRLAHLVQDRYSTMCQLCDAYNSLGDSEKEKREMLTNIDGIGKVISERVYNYLSL